MPQVGTYHAVLHLVLSDIPNSQVDTKQQLSVQGKLPPSVDVVEKMATTREESASKLARSSSQSLAQVKILIFSRALRVNFFGLALNKFCNIQ